jgi:predicted nucleic acid-binding protein
VIVVDASVIIDLLLRRDAPALDVRLLADEQRLFAPQLLDLEVAQVFRRFVRKGELAAARAAAALEDLEALSIERYPHVPLLHRIWQLRDNFTAYDAAYVALAEALAATLVTRDTRIARAAGARVTIEVI